MDNVTAIKAVFRKESDKEGVVINHAFLVRFLRMILPDIPAVTCEELVAAAVKGHGGSSDLRLYESFIDFLFSGPSPSSAVIFDCDGTVLDTEMLRSEVTFLLLAPFMPGLEKESGSFDDKKENYIMKAAGRSFKQKVADVDAARLAASLPGIDDSWASGRAGTAPAVAQAVLAARRRLGLPDRPSGAPQEAKWGEDDVVLKAVSAPCPGMPAVISELRRAGVPYNIASTSSQDSLQASLRTAGLLWAFEPVARMVHSAESDFTPPAHKPKPDVYLKAAAALGANVSESIAVEDSDSGVASAAHADMGLIIGYVGGGQIPRRFRATAARALLAGGRTENGRGADVVLADAKGIPGLVYAWRSGSLTLPLGRCLDAGGVAEPWGADVEAWLPTCL